MKELFIAEGNSAKTSLKKCITRLEIIMAVRDCLNELGIKNDEYIVVYGAAMVLRDIKETCSDIDISLDHQVFDRIVEENELKPVIYSYIPDTDIPDAICIHYNYNIDLFRGSNGCAKDPNGTMMPFGIVVQTPPSLLEEKSKRARPKDLEDAELIKKAICNSARSYTVIRALSVKEEYLK